jgi:hypothetical protein
MPAECAPPATWLVQGLAGNQATNNSCLYYQGQHITPLVPTCPDQDTMLAAQLWSWQAERFDAAPTRARTAGTAQYE